MLVASAALLGLAIALPAVAQTPASTRASNIDTADTRSDIAPQLPVPAPDASPHQYLLDAQQALGKNQTGAAQEALERAETRLLDRSTAPDAAGAPDSGPMTQQIHLALEALAHNDLNGANQAIASALSAGGMGDQADNAAQQPRPPSQPMPSAPQP
jgi:hypothetical protein